MVVAENVLWICEVFETYSKGRTIADFENLIHCCSISDHYENKIDTMHTNSVQITWHSSPSFGNYPHLTWAQLMKRDCTKSGQYRLQYRHKTIPEEEHYVAKKRTLRSIYCQRNSTYKSLKIIKITSSQNSLDQHSLIFFKLYITWLWYYVVWFRFAAFVSKMASAIWNQETKHRLNEKITSNVNDMGSLVRQITRGSKSTEASFRPFRDMHDI